MCLCERLLPAFQPSQERCVPVNIKAYLACGFVRVACGCLSKRMHVRTSSVYQVLTQKNMRLIVVWW